jgi:phosphatidylglycerol:prolipoprotein diacylglycerol transferase
MLSTFTFLGKTISAYAVCAIVGGVFISLFCALQCRFPRKKGGKVPDKQDILFMLLFAAFGMFIGAKIMYAVTSINFIYDGTLNFFQNLWEWVKLIAGGGLVFYGGLIGAAVGGLIYVFHYKIPVSESVDIAFVGVPLFHAFGRLGCFMGGCCYGMEYHGLFAVTFPAKNIGGAPAGVELLPIQLIEGGLNLILWGILFAVYRRTSRRWLTTGLYLGCYGVMRFILEYFRGDMIRGHLGVLSSSQVISIFIVLAGAFLLIKPPFADRIGAIYDEEYAESLEKLNLRRKEYKETIKARREYHKQYLKEYRAYLKAKKERRINQ